jgi:hypothetical protein
LIDVQTITIVIAAISVVIGVINSIMSNREAQQTRERELETRHAQLFMQIYMTIYDDRFMKKLLEVNEWQWEDYEDYLRKYRDIEQRTKLMTTVGFFEGLGVLVKRRLIDPVFVADLFGSWVQRFWRKFESNVKESRERTGFKIAQENIEYLYNELQKIYAQHPDGFTPQLE